MPNVRKSLEILKNRDYESLKQEHIIDYKSVYKDVRLELEKEESDMPLDQRLAEFRNGKQDLGLLCLFFHYNRYLMVASSKKRKPAG